MERPKRAKDLFDHITESRCLENEVRWLFRQIVKMTIALHDAGIVHRDIKDKNILVDTESHDIRFIDFASGTFLPDGIYNDFEGEQKFVNSCVCGSRLIQSAVISVYGMCAYTATVQR